MNETRLKMIREAENEIDCVCGGETGYLDWLPRFAPGIDLMMGHMSAQIARDLEVLPLLVLESMVGAFVALHKHAHIMWRHRDELRLLALHAPSSHQ